MVVNNVISVHMIRVGRQVLRRLEQAGFRIRAALWLASGDKDACRLIIAIPTMRVDGPKKTYQKIQALLTHPAKLRIGIEHIQVVDEHYPLITILRNGFGPRAQHIEGERLSHTTVNGYFIEDAYLYRLT